MLSGDGALLSSSTSHKWRHNTGISARSGRRRRRARPSILRVFGSHLPHLDRACTPSHRCGPWSGLSASVVCGRPASRLPGLLLIIALAVSQPHTLTPPVPLSSSYTLDYTALSTEDLLALYQANLARWAVRARRWTPSSGCGVGVGVRAARRQTPTVLLAFLNYPRLWWDCAVALLPSG